MAAVNGRLPTTHLRRIPHPAGIPVYLRKDAATAWLDMRRESVRQHGTDIHPLGGASAYRSYAQQVVFWNLYRAGRGNPAAVPGTSNHGWGLAVDVAAPAMASVIRRIGPKYGWSHDEGARVGEWWHFRYVGGYKRRRAISALTDNERRMARELIRLQHVRKPTRAQVARRKALWRALRAQRKAVWRAGTREGWDSANRRQRYAVLRRLTKV